MTWLKDRSADNPCAYSDTNIMQYNNTFSLIQFSHLCYLNLIITQSQKKKKKKGSVELYSVMISNRQLCIVSCLINHRLKLVNVAVEEDLKKIAWHFFKPKATLASHSELTFDYCSHSHTERKAGVLTCTAVIELGAIEINVSYSRFNTVSLSILCSLCLQEGLPWTNLVTLALIIDKWWQDRWKVQEWRSKRSEVVSHMEYRCLCSMARERRW